MTLQMARFNLCLSQYNYRGEMRYQGTLIWSGVDLEKNSLIFDGLAQASGCLLFLSSPWVSVDLPCTALQQHFLINIYRSVVLAHCLLWWSNQTGHPCPLWGLVLEVIGVKIIYFDFSCQFTVIHATTSSFYCYSKTRRLLPITVCDLCRGFLIKHLSTSIPFIPRIKLEHQGVYVYRREASNWGAFAQEIFSDSHAVFIPKTL